MTPLTLAAAAAAAISPASTATLSPTPNASAPAVALATLLSDARPRLLPSEQKLAQIISDELLHGTLAARGPSCAPDLPACRAAAERIAAEVARPLVAEWREDRIRYLAVVIADRMSPDQIARASEFVVTSAGHAVVEALGIFNNPIAASPALRQKLTGVSTPPATFQRASLLERFYDETKRLPRAKMPVAPPTPPLLLPREP